MGKLYHIVFQCIIYIIIFVTATATGTDQGQHQRRGYHVNWQCWQR